MIAGVKSSALRLGDRSATAIALLYAIALLFWGLAGWRAELSEIFYLGLAACGAHFIWQVRSLDIDDGPKCLKLFKSNIQFGAVMLVAIMAGSHAALGL
jgi:4-hydroxybenzoate polyprenyltransferase